MRVNKTMSATVAVLAITMMTLVGCANKPAETEVKSSSYTASVAPASWGTSETSTQVGSAVNE